MKTTKVILALVGACIVISSTGCVVRDEHHRHHDAVVVEPAHVVVEHDH